MHFESGQIYHVYNRGNDKQPIFFTEANYFFFLNKIKAEWKKNCDILCYCLMPNHFHFMMVPNDEGCKYIILAGKQTHLQNLSKTIGKTLSSYTQAINIQNKTSGNLFQKKSKAKLLTGDSESVNSIEIHDYLLTCFHYVHQNPLLANLVKHLKGWPFSSYNDYYNQRSGNICNKTLAYKMLALSEIDFEKEVIKDLDKKLIDRLF
ncbi:MAG: transposase [Chitinophagaceae bacterium]|nr:transposase [Chitinophagaceae bacterium]